MPLTQLNHMECPHCGANLENTSAGLWVCPYCGAKLPEQTVFPSSVSIILPICLVSLTITFFTGQIAWNLALPWLLGSAAGGICAGLWGRQIPVTWLHRGLGILILWGGIRYLC